MSDWKFYLFLTLLALLIQAFFALMEMAAISFNKVRLQYYVGKKVRRALWLTYLLNHPALLFGTTLILITAGLQVGSECARRFFFALGLSPDWAALTQVFLVLIVAEISPMVAGRRFAESAAMMGLPILYFTSILLRPLIWLLDLFCQLVNRLLGFRSSAEQYLSREELQKIIEEREEGSEKFNTLVANIFSLKNKKAKELMQPLSQCHPIPAFTTVGELRKLLEKHYSPFAPIYQRSTQHIVAIAYPRDLLRCENDRCVRDFARAPWFIAENASILQIIKQFRRNNQSVAVVLNETGQATGILTLDEVIDEIFGREDVWISLGEPASRKQHIVVDRTLPGDMQISAFNQQFRVHLDAQGAETLEELITQLLGHPPTKGESVRIDQFELTVEEAALFGVKMVSVRTVY